MTAEKWSAVLEIVSFFLVTIDLYGITRLIKLQKSINGIASRLRDLKFFRFYLDKFWGGANSWSELSPTHKTMLVMALISVLLFLVFGFVFAKSGVKPHITWVFLAYLFSFGVFIVFTPLIFFGVLIGLLELFLNNFLSGIIFLITKFKLEGLMLVTGAILFLISKAIILYN